MPRPCCLRRISCHPEVRLFKPAGVPARELEWVALGLDEFEALRLADFEGLYQEEAARRMGVSRPTFARIVEAARRKVAGALLRGQALALEGGAVQSDSTAQTEDSVRPGENGPGQSGGIPAPAKQNRQGSSPCGGGLRQRLQGGGMGGGKGQGAQGQGRRGRRGWIAAAPMPDIQTTPSGPRPGEKKGDASS